MGNFCVGIEEKYREVGGGGEGGRRVGGGCPGVFPVEGGTLKS